VGQCYYHKRHGNATELRNISAGWHHDEPNNKSKTVGCCRFFNSFETFSVDDYTHFFSMVVPWLLTFRTQDDWNVLSLAVQWNSTQQLAAYCARLLPANLKNFLGWPDSSGKGLAGLG
jgi:hypothetical protein